MSGGSAPRPVTGGWVDPFGVASGWRLGGTPAWTVHHVRVPGHDPVAVRVRGTGDDTVVQLAASATGSGAAAPAAAAGTGTGATAPTPAAGTGTAATAPPPPPARGLGPAQVRTPTQRGLGACPSTRRSRKCHSREGAGSGKEAPTHTRARLVTRTETHLTIELDGLTHTFQYADDWLGRDGDAWHVQSHDPVEANLTGAAHAGADALTAPMPGTVTVVKVAVGEEVTAGQSLLVVEAMKMEHVISAPHAGTVTELDVTPGATVAMDQVLAVVTPQAPQAPQEES